MKKMNPHLEYFDSTGAAKATMDNFSLSIVKAMLIPATLRKWRHNQKSRYALSQLSAKQLDDIGLSQAEAQEEYSKPFWR